MENIRNFTLVSKTDKKSYTICLEHGSMTVTQEESGDTVKFPADERPARFKMTRLPLLPVMLTINWETKLVFRLNEDQVSAISTWSGPLTVIDLALLMKERYRWLLPIAIVLIVVSFPVIDSAPGFSAEKISGYINLALGAFLLIIYVLSRSALTRFVFLMDSIWFICAGMAVTADAVFDGRYAPLLLIPLLVLGAWSGFYEFTRFKGVK